MRPHAASARHDSELFTHWAIDHEKRQPVSRRSDCLDVTCPRYRIRTKPVQQSRRQPSPKPVFASRSVLPGTNSAVSTSPARTAAPSIGRQWPAPPRCGGRGRISSKADRNLERRERLGQTTRSGGHTGFRPSRRWRSCKSP